LIVIGQFFTFTASSTITAHCKSCISNFAILQITITIAVTLQKCRIAISAMLY